MAQDASRLIWIDLEMTGLKPDADRIIEVAMVITDQKLERGGRGAGARGASERSRARRDGQLEQGHARPLRADREGQGVDACPRPKSRRRCSIF